jgi:hypothetical protein
MADKAYYLGHRTSREIHPLIEDSNSCRLAYFPQHIRWEIEHLMEIRVLDDKTGQFCRPLGAIEPLDDVFELTQANLVNKSPIVIVLRSIL